MKDGDDEKRGECNGRRSRSAGGDGYANHVCTDMTAMVVNRSVVAVIVRALRGGVLLRVGAVKVRVHWPCDARDEHGKDKYSH